MFYEGYLGRALRARAPTWLMEGMASYVADDESSLDQMVIRDAVVNNTLPPIQSLNSVTFLTYRYGNAIFQYMEDEHGIEGVRTFLFEFKKILLTGNVGKAIKESFGYDIDEFNRRFARYLRKKYFPILLEKKSPDEYGTALAPRRYPTRFAMGPAVSPSGELIATMAVPSGLELDLVILSAEDGEPIRNLTKGFTNDYEELVAEGFAGRRDVSWSGAGDRVAVIARRENKFPILVYNALTGKKEYDLVVDDIVEIAAPQFSPDGTKVAFEGNRRGVVDIFEIDLESREVRNLTEDDYFDTNPWYSEDGGTLLYNRRIGDAWKIFTVDTADSSRKTQLTFGTSNDIQPSFSRDGERIWFSSDDSPDRIYNLHSLDLGTGDIRQYTDVVAGVFAPQELAERDGESYLVFQAFFEGLYQLYRMPVPEPEREIAAGERMAEAEEAVPFEPELRLKLDAEATNPYDLKWDIDAPSVALGVADDGTVLTSASVNFTDLLGNHRISLVGNSVSSFQQYQLSYVNLKRRFNWGATAFDFRDFIYLIDPAGNVDRRTQFRTTGAQVFYQYPFSRYYRMDAQLGYLDTSAIVPFQSPGQPLEFARFQDELGIVGLSLTGDTTRYQSFGPFQGKRFTIGAQYGYQIDGDSAGDLLEYTLDFRSYKKVTRRSVLAWRLAGLISEGDVQNSRGFGGINQLRGWDYREFIGSNVAWSNLEFRFPLVDEMRFPILRLFQIRGFFFLDVGAAWFQDDLWYDPDQGRIRTELIPVDADGDGTIDGFTAGQPIEFDFWDSENNRLQDARGAYGFGFQFIFLGGLQFNWTWAERLAYSRWVYDLDAMENVRIEEDGGDRRMEFYIAFDW